MKPMRRLPRLYAQTPLGLLARDWLDRHRRMVAWNNAVIINTAAGYRAFLAKFPDSDLTATARKLEERLRNRPDFTPAVARPRRRAAKRRAGRADLSLQRAAGAAAEEGRCAGQARRSGSAQARRSQAAAARVCPRMMSWWFAVRRRAWSMSLAGPPIGIGIGIGLGGGGGYGGGNYGGGGYGRRGGY